jgi:hypothetical protein
MFRVCAARSRLMKRGATYLLLVHSDGCARLRLALPVPAHAATALSTSIANNACLCSIGFIGRGPTSRVALTAAIPCQTLWQPSPGSSARLYSTRRR